MATVNIVLDMAVAILIVVYILSYCWAHNANTTIIEVLVDNPDNITHSCKRTTVVCAIVILLILQWIGLGRLMTVDDDVAATDKHVVLWAQVVYYILQWGYVPILIKARSNPNPWLTWCKVLLFLAAGAQIVSSVYVILWTLARDDLEYIAVFLLLYAAWTIVFDCALYSGHFGNNCGCMVGIRMPSVTHINAKSEQRLDL